MSSGLKRLEGKSALITGAASGIGKASALLFAREGASVLAVDIDEAGCKSTVAEIKSQGGVAEPFVADVSAEEDMEEAVERCISLYGKIDIIYNNAGAVFGGLIPDLSFDLWQKEIAVNLTSVYLGARFAIPHMREQGYGVILSTSSNAGIIGRPTIPAYGAAKAGVVALTKALALAHAKDGIRVNCICPGSIRTAAMGFGPKTSQPTDQRNRVEHALASVIPMGRVGRPEEVARAALFLASDEASYITGVALPVDGGRTAGIAEPRPLN